MKYNKFQVITYIFLLMEAIGGASTDIFLPALPTIGKEFNSSVPVLNLTISLYVCGLAVGCLFTSYVSDRIGRKSTLLWYNSLYVITSLLIGTTYFLWPMILLRFIQGLAVAGPLIVCRQIIKESFPKEMHLRSFGALSLGTFLSPAIAPIIGAYITSYISWRFCFILPAILMIILILLSKYFVSETIINYQKLPNILDVVKDLKLFVRSGVFVWHILISASIYGAYFSFISLSSEICVTGLGMSVLLYSKIFLLLALSYLAGNKLMVFLDKKGWNESKIIRAAVTCALFGALVFLGSLFSIGNIPKIILICIAASFIRMGYACVANPVMSHLMSVFPEKNGLALGFIIFFTAMAGSICSQIVSLMHANLLLGLVLTTVALVIVALVSSFVVSIRYGRLTAKDINNK